MIEKVRIETLTVFHFRQSQIVRKLFTNASHSHLFTTFVIKNNSFYSIISSVRMVKENLCKWQKIRRRHSGSFAKESFAKIENSSFFHKTLFDKTFGHEITFKPCCIQRHLNESPEFFIHPKQWVEMFQRKFSASVF